jgi:tellurite methyltransferase
VNQARWDERHAQAIAEGRGDRPPADWVFSHASLIEAQPRGRALDIACGRGRNALYLAGFGFEVEALDGSRIAIEHLRTRAARAGLPVNARVADLSAEPLPPGPFEVIVNAFFLERALLGPISEALAPGGLLLFVTFVGGSFSLREGELRSAFEHLSILEYREGPPLPGDRPRACLVARKPGASGAAHLD